MGQHTAAWRALHVAHQRHPRILHQDNPSGPAKRSPDQGRADSQPGRRHSLPHRSKQGPRHLRQPRQELRRAGGAAGAGVGGARADERGGGEGAVQRRAQCAAAEDEGSADLAARAARDRGGGRAAEGAEAAAAADELDRAEGAGGAGERAHGVCAREGAPGGGAQGHRSQRHRRLPAHRVAGHLGAAPAVEGHRGHGASRAVAQRQGCLCRQLPRLPPGPPLLQPDVTLPPPRRGPLYIAHSTFR
mmetsp:Transcript_8360/g.13266  ORF Transcript_8360/g.13266 Transcript_8360/m.13266 type:complete len:246 (+) Transcript_8360:259-996(+)